MRKAAAVLLLCMLAGCAAPQGVGPWQAADRPAGEISPSEEAVPSEGSSPAEASEETAPCLPESLLQELRLRMLNGTDTYEDLEPLQAERPLSEEEAAALAPELLTCDSAADAVYSHYSAVDFDNDGLEDIFAYRRMGMGTMGRFLLEFWQGQPDGTYAASCHMDACMGSPLFITWEGRNYFLMIQHDLLSKAGTAQFTYTGLYAVCFDSGRERESAWLTFDPTVLWTEGLYDASGAQTGWVEGAPADREIVLSICTRSAGADVTPPSQ